MKYSKIILRSGKDEAVRRFHPWIFSGAIKKMEGVVNEGDNVKVYSNQDEYLATGYYQIGSIAVRIFSFEDIEPDLTFWKSRIARAYNYRKSIGIADNLYTNVYRLIHAEGDILPGLIVDYYNGNIVIQAHSIGMHIQRGFLVEAFKEIYGKNLKSVYDKSSETLPKQASYKSTDGYLFGNGNEKTVLENGNSFLVDWETGQKTGFFIDQRNNRKLLARYSKGKSVLNTFCYSGGFSVYAAKAGASVVHSVDSSKKAIELTNKNMELNKFDTALHTAIAADTMEYLKSTEKLYDIIILDPPAYAKHLDVKHNAIQGYKRLNAQALQMIKKGGLLFTFSCSQVVDRHLFTSTITSAAIQVKRNVRILHHLSQPEDHPVNIFHPEGEYLKGLVLFVD